MNEEIALAIDELRLRPTARAWFIPVKLNKCPIPQRSIGGGETLCDIQWVDLSEDWDAGIETLIATLLPLHQRHERRFEEALDYVIDSFKRMQKRRPKTEVFTVGIMGYTGVGKSSLIMVLL